MLTILIDPKNLQARWNGHFWDVVSIDVSTRQITIENSGLEEKFELDLGNVELHVIIE